MKWICTLGLLAVVLNSYAQKEDYVWVMGNLNNPADSSFAATTIDFNYDPPKIDLRYNFYPQSLASTSICDINGELLLYSNGLDIYDSQDNVINNGHSLQLQSTYPSGFPVMQGILTLPFPGSKDSVLYLTSDLIVYQFEGNYRHGASPLSYSVIDLSSPSEALVLDKKIPVSYDTLMPGHLAAVQHGNGRDWWIVGAPMLGSNKYNMFLASPNGVQWSHSQSIGTSVNVGASSQVAFSPNGEWLAYYQLWGLIPLFTFTEINLYKFDRCSGMLSDHIQIQDTIGLHGGVAFSPNSNFMYTAHTDTIYQCDLTSTDIANSRIPVAAYDGFTDENGAPTRFRSLKLAPNGKIYISIPHHSSRYLHVIEQPDLPGAACNVLQHTVQMPTYNYRTFPNHPVSRLGVMEGSPCDTLTTAVRELQSPQQQIARVFPNPAHGQVSLALGTPSLEPVQWVLFDALGRQVRAMHIAVGQESALMDIQGLPPGFYVYHLKMSGQLLESGKLVIE